MSDPRRNPEQILSFDSDAACGRSARSAPLVHENSRSAPFDSIGPVPVSQNDQIIHRISPAQQFVTVSVGLADHQIIIRVGHVVRPHINWPDRQRPVSRARHPVGPVKHTDNPVHATGRGTVPFRLVVRHTTPPDGPRKPPPQKTQVCRRDNKVGHLHVRSQRRDGSRSILRFGVCRVIKDALTCLPWLPDSPCYAGFPPPSAAHVPSL